MGSMRTGGAGLLCAVAIAGCGTPPNAPSSAIDHDASAAVTRALARALLDNRENVTRAPTEREVTAIVHRRVVTAACRHQDDAHVGCQVRLKGFPPYGCTATVRDGSASDLRCGSTAAAPRVQQSFVDCSTVGRTRTVSDPRDDTFTFAPGNPPPQTNTPSADVTSIAVAANRQQLCANLTLAAPATPDTAITFLAARRTETQTPSESLTATIHLDPRQPGVNTLDHGWISARLGTAGDQVSLVIDAAALTPALRYLFTDGFRFHVHSNDARRGQDEAPAGNDWPTYP